MKDLSDQFVIPDDVVAFADVQCLERVSTSLTYSGHALEPARRLSATTAANACGTTVRVSRTSGAAGTGGAVWTGRA